MKTRMMYMENKVTGEARIGLVTFSRTFKTIYYKGKIFHRPNRRGTSGNYYEEETGEEYWISGPKKRGNDRLYEPTSLIIDKDVEDEYKKFLTNN